MPIRFFDLLSEFKFPHKARHLNSVVLVEEITDKMRTELCDLLARPYNETRVIKKYAFSLIEHFDSCAHCQGKAVKYVADIQAFRRTIAKARLKLTDIF